jgi:hypothetical protein
MTQSVVETRKVTEDIKIALCCTIPNYTQTELGGSNHYSLFKGQIQYALLCVQHTGNQNIRVEVKNMSTCVPKVCFLY